MANHTAIVVTDLTFGDAGKGSITDALVRQHGARMVVRYNGGAQAAHTVITPEGKSHIFHQFGSGTLVQGTETFLSRFMLVNPLALYHESENLNALGISDTFERMHIDARALVTTPYHVVANRLHEIARGAGKHGSCGMGIGETACDALDNPDKVLRIGELRDSATLLQKLKWHRDYKRRQLDYLLPQLPEIGVDPLLDQLHSDDELDAAHEVFSFIASQVHIESPEFLPDRMSAPGCTVFEGAQGVLLDEDWGFHPHTTWSHTTSSNALALIQEAAPEIETTVLGLTRAYQTRHGEGPFPTEDEYVTRTLYEPHNPTNDWQGPFRAGWLDLPLLHYALQADGKIDGLVITCLDRLHELSHLQIATEYKVGSTSWAPEPFVATLEHREAEGNTLREVDVTYTAPPSDPWAYASKVSQMLGKTLLGISYGPTAEDKKFLF